MQTLGAEVYMDDKRYFCFDGDNMPDSASYYTNDNLKCSDDVCFSGKF